MNAIQSFHIDPMVPYSVKMTRLHAGGESTNIIPGNASFVLDLRAQTNSAINLLADKVEQRILAIGNLYGTEIGCVRVGQTMAAEVSPEARDIVAVSIVNILGEDALAPDIVTAGGKIFITTLRSGQA
ncbi:hypothetical protein [Alicyclobacillus fastidiosus]|uniref:hypothetical protein n=1 Tax=Alicyclobacillus fastidiosus TaxID=392011 RepID=UPI0023E9D37D|nr:hypothetical protein [Alicyclobacillus fastidiosus]GMA61341.1 hypothetical protein GCM10025859_17810 [Alicyclobacillus fastidiosus]